MTKVVQNFLLYQKIGEGQFGEVYRAQHMHNDDSVAIKMLSFEKFQQSAEIQDLIINEVQTLKKLQHPNIIKCHKLLKTSKHVYLVYELCQDGDLQAYISKQKRLKMYEIVDIYKQVLEAVKYIHSKDIIHCDIKPENILIQDTTIIKLADFGLCKNLKNPNERTPIYMPPETLNGGAPSKSSDVYSLGIMLYELIFRKCPHQDGGENNLDYLIQRKNLNIIDFDRESDVSPEPFKELIAQMISVNPLYRPTIDTVYNAFKTIIPNDSPGGAPIFNSLQPDTKSTMTSSNNNYLSSLPESMYASKNQPLDTMKLNALIRNDPLDEEEEYLNFIRLVLKQRNQSVFIINIVNAIIDANINKNAVQVVYLLCKKMFVENSMLYRRLKLQELPFEVNKQIWNMFNKTGDYAQFIQILEHEDQSIKDSQTSFLDLIYEENLNETDQDLNWETENVNDINQKYLYQLLLQYALEVRDKALDQQNNLEKEDQAKQFLVHAVNILDCANIEGFFEDFISHSIVNMVNQTYFAVMGSLNFDDLDELVKYKANQIQELIENTL